MSYLLIYSFIFLEQALQDEADTFYILYKIGRSHGKFVASIIHEVSQEVSRYSTFLSKSFSCDAALR